MKKALYIILFFITINQLFTKNGWYELESGTDKFFYGVCFVDSLYGWAVGDDGLILHTKNGGKNWTVQDANVGSWLSSVHFIDRMNGWVVGDIGRIRHTTDGGSRWKLQYPEFYMEKLNSIFFANENKGWAVGPSGIIHTENGGDNWYFQDSANYTVSKSIFFVNEYVGFACGANGTIVKTVDAGETWQKLETGSTGIFYDVFFLDLSYGWALSRHEPKILRTTNGGKDWKPQNQPIDGFFSKIQFIDKNTGWAAGQSGVIFSSDGGKNWKVQIPDSRYNLWWMNFVDKNHGWAVGGNGTILKTDNGGVKFTVDFIANVLTGEAPLSTTFTDLSDGNHNQWHWDFGDGGTHSTQNPVYVYQNPGTYNVSLSISDGTDNDAATKYDYITVTGKNDLTADFTADTTEGEAPLLVQFTDLSTGNPDKWEWDFGNGATHISQNPLQVYQNSGTYTVSLKVSRGQSESSEVKKDYIKVKNPISVTDYDYLFNIKQAIPNPASEWTSIEYELISDAELSIDIFDIYGRKINNLHDGFIGKGKHRLIWNFKENSSQILAEGIYSCRFSIKANNKIYNEIRKIILLQNN